MYVLYILIYIPIHAMAYTRKEKGVGEKTQLENKLRAQSMFIQTIFL